MQQSEIKAKMTPPGDAFLDCGFNRCISNVSPYEACLSGEYLELGFSNRGLLAWNFFLESKMLRHPNIFGRAVSPDHPRERLIERR
jgi:hypothetical protein